VNPSIRYSDGTVREGKVLSAADLPDLQLDGEDLRSIEMDHATHFNFDKTRVTLEGTFRLSAGEATYEFDFDVRSSFGPLMAIYPSTLQSATINSELTLRLEFEGGEVIETKQDPHYEAWQISGPESRLIVCPPAGGGGLSVWL
jgi:hypothetical protein